MNFIFYFVFPFFSFSFLLNFFLSRRNQGPPNQCR